MLDKNLLHILQHSLGVDQYGKGKQYRNHFAVGPGNTTFENCISLCNMGLMEDLGIRDLWGNMHCFVVTEKGKETVSLESPAPPKLTRSQERYRRYLEMSDSFDNFKHFLHWDSSNGKK